MDYGRFIAIVEQHAQVGPEAAERATRAALQTLAERIAAGEARDLAAQLPPELAPWLFSEGGAERFDVDEFVRRVAEGEEADLATAERHARAVFTALESAVSADELADMLAELPRDFDRLRPRGRYIEIVPVEELLGRVGDRAGLDADRARRATEAVLETLAERIAGGEVDDLIERLPIELHDSLKRGSDRSGGVATRMSADEFVRRVAEREGTPPEQAREHARAVFAALREAIGDQEFVDVTVQLPDDYEALLARP